MSMNDLSALDDLVAEQDRGAPLTIRHPTSGEPMGIVLIVAGPDSDTARRARLQMQDEQYAFTKRPSAEELDRMDIERLARLVVSWTATRNNVDVPYSFTNVVKLLRENLHVREQVATFSQSRVSYFLKNLPSEPNG